MAKRQTRTTAASLPDTDTPPSTDARPPRSVKLVSLAFKNFLGASEQVELSVSSFSVIVGKNDVGKSTILKALEMLIGGKSPTEDHICRYSGNRIIEISGVFHCQHVALDLDEGHITEMTVEGILDGRSQLHIKRIWDFSTDRCSTQIFIKADVYGDDECLLLKNQQELIRLCRERNIATASANGDDFNNAEKRDKLRQFHSESGTNRTHEWVPLGLTGTGRAKKIYDGLIAILPRFEYFRADSSLEESDSAIQNYLKKVVNEAIAVCSLADIQDAVRGRLDAVLNSLTGKINRSVPRSEQVEPVVEFDWSKLVKTTFRTRSDNVAVPLSQRGDGFRRIAMMSFFEHLAELGSAEQPLLLGFEEPETFLHPSAQEHLCETLSSLPDSGHQVLICTHSPIIVARTSLQHIVHVHRDGQSLRVSQGNLTYHGVANDLGISVKNQFLATLSTTKCLLLVEGIDDAEVLHHVASTYKSHGVIQETFVDLGVTIVPLGGKDSIGHWVALDLLRGLEKPFFIILDSDKTSASDVSSTETTLSGLGFISGQDFVVTRKRMIENYMPVSFLNSRCPGAALSYTDFCHVKNICKTHHLNARLGGGKVLQHNFQHMALADMQVGFCYAAGAQANDEFLDWITAIRSRIPVTP